MKPPWLHVLIIINLIIYLRLAVFEFSHVHNRSQNEDVRSSNLLAA